MDKITLGGGCFWCIEGVYNNVTGVQSAISGYMDGHVENPTYREVCSGTTGHNEVVQITFDSEIIDLKTILSIFWTVHDPTTLNRQGNDVGTQYRSGIYYESEEQLEIIKESLEEAKSLWDKPIVTQIAPATEFYLAEEYHQNYYENNPNQGYCAYIIAPKIAKFRSKFSSYIKS